MIQNSPFSTATRPYHPNIHTRTNILQHTNQQQQKHITTNRSSQSHVSNQHNLNELQNSSTHHRLATRSPSVIVQPQNRMVEESHSRIIQNPHSSHQTQPQQNMFSLFQNEVLSSFVNSNMNSNSENNYSPPGRFRFSEQPYPQSGRIDTNQQMYESNIKNDDGKSKSAGKSFSESSN